MRQIRTKVINFACCKPMVNKVRCIAALLFILNG